MANEKFYHILADPKSFVETFDSMEDFVEWASDGSVLDIKEFIKLLEVHELYEYCHALQMLIKDLK